jgi:hypothetical protein
MATRPASLLAAAALASLPFESTSLAFPLGPLTVTLPEALLGLAVAVTALAAWEARRDAPLLVDGRFVVAVGLFLGVLLVSAALAPEQQGNAVRFTLRLAGGAAFGWAVAWLVRADPARGGLLLGAYAGGVVAAAGIGLLELQLGARLDPLLARFRDHPVYVAGVRRLTGTYGYSNIAATSMALALPVLAALQSRVALVAIAAVVPALMLTYSRGGFCAALLGLLALAWLAGPGRRARPWGAAVALAVAWVVLAQVDTLLPRRTAGQADTALLAARVQAPPARLLATSGTRGVMRVSITNTGSLPWASSGEAPYRVTSVWYDVGGRRLPVPTPRTELPAYVKPGQTVTVEGRYIVPEHRGRAWLVWDVLIERRLYLGEYGSARGWVPAVVGRDEAEARQLDAALPESARPATARAWIQPTRGQLWTAALAMARERPWVGQGPDSYRWTYGRYLDLSWWDTRVYANNLALELLATTGALGLAAFLAVLGVSGWAGLARLRGAIPPESRRWLAVGLAMLVVVLAHGLVDYFLEFTAGYVPLWTAAGLIVGLAAPDVTRS